jgi:LytS/YehU family sensor histidine kinase
MSGRLTVLTEVEPGLESLDFPPMVLATLAENAIKHGVFPQNGGRIVIAAQTVGDMVEVSLLDDGVGLSGDGGGGLGLANIVERLRLLYGPRATLQLRQNSPRGVCALVRIPRQAPPT